MTSCSRRSFLLGAAITAAASRPARGFGDLAGARFRSLLWSRLLQSQPPKDVGRFAPRIIPAADANRLYLSLSGRVLAVNLQTGNPTWPGGRDDDDGAIFRGSPDSQASSPTASTSALLSEGRLVTLSGSIPSHATGATALASFPTLSAFDVQSGEGRLLWTQGLSGTLAVSGWEAAGLPCLAGDAVWIPVRNRQRPELALAELETTTGMVRSIVPVAASGRGRRHWRAGPPASRHGRMFCQYSDGSLVAVSIADRKTLWETETEPAAAEPAPGSGLIIGEGLVYAATTRGTIQALDENTGQLRWEFLLDEENAQVCGSRDGRLICAGRRIWVLDAASGSPLERWGWTDAPLVGRPAMNDQFIVWSTDRELLMVDHARGSVVDRRPLLVVPGLRGGDVWLFDRHLVLLGGTQVSAFEVS